MGDAGLKGGKPERDGTAAPTKGRILLCTVILALGAASDVFFCELDDISARDTARERVHRPEFE